MGSLPEALSPRPVGQQPLSRDLIVDHQRDRVAEAAIEVFAKRGYLGTTVDHIVDAAKIGVGRFYELFPGKEGCLLHAYDLITGEARAQVSMAVSTAADWPDQVRSGLGALLVLLAAHPFRARVALVEIQTAGPVALARYEATLDSIAPFLAAGRSLSPFADELPPSLELAVTGGLTWFLQQRVVMGDLGKIEQTLPDLLSLVIEPYLGEAAASGYVEAATEAVASGD